ncbi:Gfo/Idh/MocA family protein [Leptospira kirschneri]|uniref:Gfo/Idh/MocA family protein n=1 Tax=Leptospira kirschneri TaxID=29507 RepID=UPI003563460B
MIPVLLIGLGRIASLLEKDSFRNHPCTHAGAIFSTWGRKKFFLIGAIDPSEERRNIFCKDWNIPKEACFPDFKSWAESFLFNLNRKDFSFISQERYKNLESNRKNIKFVSQTDWEVPVADFKNTNFVHSSRKKKDRDLTNRPNDRNSARIQKSLYVSEPKKMETFQKKGLQKQVPITKDYFQNNNEFIKNLFLKNKKSFELTSCLVIIATPSETHYELAKTAIDFGFRRLLVEKPVCHSLPLARKLAKLCKKTKTNLWVNHERRYHPLYIQVRKWIQEKTFGPVRTIRASVLTSARDPGRAILDKTGPLFHDGTHAVDLLIWYLGMPDRVVSVLRSYPHSTVEEQALAFMTYPQGETVFLEAGGMRNYFQFELDIQTENARFLVGNDEVRFWKSKPSRKYKGFKSLTPVSISEKSSAGSNPFLNLYDSIFRYLSGKPSSITGDIEENLQILTLLDTIRRKAEKRILED